MTWVAFIKAVLDFLNGFFGLQNNRAHQELGRLKEQERQDAENRDLADRIRAVDPDSVSDDKAFGVGGRDNDLSRP